jgi:hypothetical protein
VVAPFAGVALMRFAGYVSVKATPVIATALLLFKVMVIVEFVPGATVFGAKALIAVGRALTVRFADAAAVFDPALVVEIPPIGMVLVTVPGVEDVTSMVKVQVRPAGIVPLVNVTLPANDVGRTPQLVWVMLGVAAVVTPAG